MTVAKMAFPINDSLNFMCNKKIPVLSTSAIISQSKRLTTVQNIPQVHLYYLYVYRSMSFLLFRRCKQYARVVYSSVRPVFVNFHVYCNLYIVYYSIYCTLIVCRNKGVAYTIRLPLSTVF